MKQQVIADKTYVSERIRIDDKSFVNCSFKDCEFEWYGNPAQDMGCTFEGSRFILIGEALRFHVTLQRFGLDLNYPILKTGDSIQNAPEG